MPNRILLIFITLLLGIGSASAQKYPERSLVRKGNRDFAKERYDRSIERYTQALEAAPENFEAASTPAGMEPCTSITWRNSASPAKSWSRPSPRA